MPTASTICCALKTRRPLLFSLDSPLVIPITVMHS